MTHTPGPWRVEAATTVIWSDNAYDPATNSVGCIVARAAQTPSWKASRPTADEQEANALLIAAAPDLLEASKDLLVAWSKLAAALPQDDRIEAVEFEEIMGLRVAVAKAIGISSWEVTKHLASSEA